MSEHVAFTNAIDPLVPILNKGHQISHADLRATMLETTGGTDADGAWSWADAFDVAEAAAVRFLINNRQRLPLQDHGKMIALLGRLEGMLPSRTRRDDETDRLQQFSTPFRLSYIASLYADVQPGMTVLEPSAGTGVLAAMAAIRGATVVCNEISKRRYGLLSGLFDQVYTCDATHIHDMLPDSVQPDCVFMNPPFGRLRGESTKSRKATFVHIQAAANRLCEGGRLVSITGDRWHVDDGFYGSQVRALGDIGLQLQLSLSIGDAFKRMGTSWPVRISVWDKTAELSETIPSPNDITFNSLAALANDLPGYRAKTRNKPALTFKRVDKTQKFKSVSVDEFENLKPMPVHFEVLPPAPIKEVGNYAAWRPKLKIVGANSHPGDLVESLALASTSFRAPNVTVELPPKLVNEGILSDAQLHTVLQVNAAHETYLPGRYLPNKTVDYIELTEDEESGHQYRAGFLIGDGTGVGKGRELSAIIFANMVAGRKKAVWISLTGELVEDARRDWVALGGSPTQMVEMSRFRMNEKIGISEGILFVPYATLRQQKPQFGQSRLRQLIDWLGEDFDGVIAFDESHAMSHALSTDGIRGKIVGTQQGKVGIQLQNHIPNARVVYASATNSVNPRELAYATRLGLYGKDCPFISLSAFLSAMEKGGISAQEIVSRDLMAAGRYCCRNLSFEGIEYQRLDVTLTEKQIAVWDTYADAFQIIQSNVLAALEACNTLNDGRQRGAAIGAFEGVKQRFFSQLLGSMLAPSVIKSMQSDIDAGHSPILQITTTAEAYLHRALETVHPSQYHDLKDDFSPRRMILQYVEHSFPTLLFQEVEGDHGIHSVPVVDDLGVQLHCQAALEARDDLLEKIATLPPMASILDQVIWHFGPDQVSEVTGRSIRVLFKDGRYYVEKRSKGARLRDIHAHCNDERKILIFSDAGGTGRSYNASLTYKNQRLRRHYLGEAGWNAKKATQGLGRSDRSNQRQKPEYIFPSSDIPGQARFISTITSRLDQLGAMTKGQRETGSNGLLSADDSLEGPVAENALSNFLTAVCNGLIPEMSKSRFAEITGLDLEPARRDAISVNKFLNRLLALRVADQRLVFAEFTGRYNAAREVMAANGQLAGKVKVIHAEDIRHLQDLELTTSLFGTTFDDEYEMTVEKVYPSFETVDREKGSWMINDRTRAVAHIEPCSSLFHEDGSCIPRISLLRPDGTEERLKVNQFEEAAWVKAPRKTIAEALWHQAQIDLPKTDIHRFWLVTGALLPVWTHVSGAFGQIDIVRLVTNGTDSKIGARISASRMTSILAAFGKLDIMNIDASTLTETILNGDAGLTLRNSWQIRKSVVSGVPRIEMTGPDFTDRDRLKALGVFIEKINYTVRWFIPVDRAADVLAEILKLHPLA